MASRTTNDAVVDSSLYEWPSIFISLQRDLYNLENSPYVVREIPQQEETSEEIVQRFLQHVPGKFGDNDPDFHLEMEVEAFCSPIDFNILRQGEDNKVKRPLALLNDRNNEGHNTHTAGNRRENDGPLSAHALYTELKKPVRQPRIDVLYQLSRTERLISLQRYSNNHPNAQRRLL
jgi:hypothetical protein